METRLSLDLVWIDDIDVFKIILWYFWKLALCLFLKWGRCFMEEAKSKFRMLVVTEQLIDYVNNILPDYPKKEVVLKTKYWEKSIWTNRKSFCL